MEQKLVRVKFDVELAKKITSGEVEGRIFDTYYNCPVRIVDFNFKTYGHEKWNIGVSQINENKEKYFICNDEGVLFLDAKIRLNDKPVIMLDVPEYMTFKDGDVIAFDGKEAMFVLRKNERYFDSHSFPPYYVGIDEFGFVIFGKEGAYCRADRGRLATEEEKVQFAEKLKVNKDPRAKEYLEKYFGIKDSPKVSNSAKIGKEDFKPFDKVLVRYSDESEWCARFFDRMFEGDYACTDSLAYKYCIRYEGNEHLHGTNKSE